MLMLPSPLLLCDSIVSTPSMPASASSSTCVMRVSTTAADAPGYSTETETIGGSIAGSSRSVRRVNAIRPSTTSSRLITVAKTGRRIERSDRTTSAAGSRGGRGVRHARAVAQLDRALGHDRVASVSPETISTSPRRREPSVTLTRSAVWSCDTR